MPRALAVFFTATSNCSGRRMFTRASFFSNSNKTRLAPERSYCVRSAVSRNAAACLSLLNAGIFFFIVLNLLAVHISSTYRADVLFARLFAYGEDQKT